MSLLRSLAKEQGCTVLMVTHDPRIIDVADRVAIWKMGFSGNSMGTPSFPLGIREKNRYTNSGITLFFFYLPCLYSPLLLLSSLGRSPGQFLEIRVGCQPVLMGFTFLCLPGRIGHKHNEHAPG